MKDPYPMQDILADYVEGIKPINDEKSDIFAELEANLAEIMQHRLNRQAIPGHEHDYCDDIIKHLTWMVNEYRKDWTG